MEYPQRKHIRLKEYDYSQNGAYFITICTHERKPLFWTQPVGADSIRPQEAQPLSQCGKIAETAIQAIQEHYPQVHIDKYVIMPNHIHMILRIEMEENGRIVSAPTVSVIVGQMKRWASKQIGQPVWQKSFYEHIIRNDRSYQEVWQYIDENPARWPEDAYYTI